LRTVAAFLHSLKIWIGDAVFQGKEVQSVSHGGVLTAGHGPLFAWKSLKSLFLFIYFILRHGAHGLWPKDEKESKKGEIVTAAKETRKHTSK
jgi:hypothetical protein